MDPKYFSGLILGLVIAAAAGTYAFWEKPIEDGRTSSGSVSRAAIVEFTEMMRAKVITEIGQPIEGFEPFMFMRVFPGLTAQDFDKVDALIGLYRYENGQVVYDLNGEPELHSAARAISDEGMEQLLMNITTRLNYNLESAATIKELIDAIDSAPGSDPTSGAAEPGTSPEPTQPMGSDIMVRGTIVCLPHRGDGPHTMECAIGLKADDGKHYALKNFSYPDQGDVQERIQVTGKLLTSGEFHQRYDIVGTLEVTKVQKI
ncbi:MAG TPA: hypothetical protein VD928_00765 [Candidatus Paceibacterota bacterium]|nr:hypothetical protein [Candidatus Paceibacterota bacterium]